MISEGVLYSEAKWTATFHVSVFRGLELRITRVIQHLPRILNISFLNDVLGNQMIRKHNKNYFSSFTVQFNKIFLSLFS